MFKFKTNNFAIDKKKIRISDLQNKIIYIPGGDSNSAKSFKEMIKKNGDKNEIKRIDSATMAQIIQEYDNCVGEANCLYLKKEIDEKLFTVLDTDFEIPKTETGIYYRKDRSSKELRSLIKIIKKIFDK